MSKNDKPQPDQPDSDRPELDEPLNAALESDAALKADAEAAAAASDTFEQAADDLSASDTGSSEADEEQEEPETEPAGKQERLQKILAQSGIASRRHAEELITEGRVQVNGKVVTELGSKADPSRDHIRVDGKLLQGSERQRYFMLNKPKGYVTTVSDPEGRPTIMEFFSKTKERLYPVGRLDYLSEGLLLVTNDGELANKLTRAASGVEKTYLVKISGQPSEEDLERLREGVSISKGKAGSGRVQTAPAQIRPFRPGKPGGQRGAARSSDNPWYEVVLIEGRNRELRKMFEEIGHHVEKIRRVGYGPLVLDLEPGKIRELDPEEVENLRKAAEGKYRKPKQRESRKREFAPRPERSVAKPRWNERHDEGRNARGGGERRPFRGDRGRSAQRSAPGSRPQERDQFRSGPRREFRPENRPGAPSSQDRPQRPPYRGDQERRAETGARGNRGRFAQSLPQRGAKPAWKNPERGSRPPNRFQRNDRRAPGEFHPRPAEERPQRFDRKPPAGPAGGFEARKRLEIEPVDANPRGPETRFEGRNRAERPTFNPRGGPRSDRDRSQGSRSGSRQQRGQGPAEGSSFERDRQKPRFERPRSNERTRRNEDRPARQDRRPDQRPDRRPDQRPSGPRAGGNFKPERRGSGGAGKQGSVRSGGGRRPGSRAPGSKPSGSRPGGNRGGKRRP